MDATLRLTARQAETARDMIVLAGRTARHDHRAALRLLADAEAALTRECCAMRDHAIQKAKDSYKGCQTCHGTGTIQFKGQTRHCPRIVPGRDRLA